MDHLADVLDQAADTMTALSREVPSLAVAPTAFGAMAGDTLLLENRADL